MNQVKLNLSQTQIAMSEQTGPGSALNTISVKIHLPEHSASEVKKAADTVLDSADIFAAHLNCKEQPWTLSYGDSKISGCVVTDEKSIGEAYTYTDMSDTCPLDIGLELYKAQVIPLTEGGCLLYVRFYHIIREQGCWI